LKQQVQKVILISDKGGAQFELWKIMAKKASEYGWRLFNLSLSNGWVPKNISPIGAIINYPSPHPTVEHMKKIGCPIIRLGNYPHPDDDIIPAIMNNSAAFGKLGATHFYERGFSTVGYIANSPFSLGKHIYEAFKDQSREYGLDCHLLGLTLEDNSSSEKFESLSNQIEIWLNSLPKPIGIMTYSNKMAARLSYVCMTKGWAIPEDISILGIGNNSFYCETAAVDLSSIETDTEEYGNKAIELLNKHIKGQAPKSPIKIEPKGITVRHSTDVYAVKDPKVKKALGLIRDKYNSILTIDDIAKHSELNRRTLERAFKKNLGQAPNVILRQKRLEKSQHLLASTNQSISVISNLVGMGNKLNLHRAFKEHYGITPGDYRKELKKGSLQKQ